MQAHANTPANSLLMEVESSVTLHQTRQIFIIRLMTTAEQAHILLTLLVIQHVTHISGIVNRVTVDLISITRYKFKTPDRKFIVVNKQRNTFIS